MYRLCCGSLFRGNLFIDQNQVKGVIANKINPVHGFVCLLTGVEPPFFLTQTLSNSQFSHDLSVEGLRETALIWTNWVKPLVLQNSASRGEVPGSRLRRWQIWAVSLLFIKPSLSTSRSDGHFTTTRCTFKWKSHIPDILQPSASPIVTDSHRRQFHLQTTGYAKLIWGAEMDHCFHSAAHSEATFSFAPDCFPPPSCLQSPGRPCWLIYLFSRLCNRCNPPSLACSDFSPSMVKRKIYLIMFL